jgi:hypothetical protein
MERNHSLAANAEGAGMASKYIRVVVVWVVTLAALYVFQAAFGRP